VELRCAPWTLWLLCVGCCCVSAPLHEIVKYSDHHGWEGTCAIMPRPMDIVPIHTYLSLPAGCPQCTKHTVRTEHAERTERTERTECTERTERTNLDPFRPSPV